MPEGHGVSAAQCQESGPILLRDLLAAVQGDSSAVQRLLHLTAYENSLSKLAARYLSDPLGARYHLGTMHDRGHGEAVVMRGLLFRGLPGLYELEALALAAGARMFQASYTDARGLSGIHAVICSLTALTNPGDLVYSIDPADGGHFATKHIVERLGRRSEFLAWDPARLTLDIAGVRRNWSSNAGQAILLDHGTPLFPLPLADLREVVGRSVRIIYDGSHTLGLIAGGCFQSPLREGADLVQGNTHKTFPGPQKALIMCREGSVGDQVRQSITDGFVSSQHTHETIALHVTLLEMEAFGAAYAMRMLANAQTLAEEMRRCGFSLVKVGQEVTRSHQILLDGFGPDEHFAIATRLLRCGIATNARTAFRRPVLRLGTQQVSRIGMGDKEMRHVAALFARAVLTDESEDTIKRDTEDLVGNYSRIAFSFDEDFAL